MYISFKPILLMSAVNLKPLASRHDTLYEKTRNLLKWDDRSSSAATCLPNPLRFIDYAEM